MTTLMLANEYQDNPTIEIPENGAFAYMPTAPGCSAIIGTQVPQLGNTNFYSEIQAENFVIEACEYKRSFLQYHPYITVITNIDLDHLDYYKNLEDYSRRSLLWCKKMLQCRKRNANSRNESPSSVRSSPS